MRNLRGRRRRCWPVETVGVGLVGVVGGPVGRISGGIDRRARGLLGGPGRQAVLAGVDLVLWGVDGVVRSSLAEEVVDRVAASALADGLLDRVLASASADGVLDRVVASALADGVLDRVVERVVESAAAERLVRGVMESRLIDAVLAELLESDGLWVMIEEIAQSPAVTNAISQQGVGFANQMAGVVRDRSRTADDRLERLARRFTRRARSGPPDPLAVDLQVDGAPVVERVVVEEIVLDSMTVDPPGGIGRAPEP